MDRVLTYVLTKDKSKDDYRLLSELCHNSKNLYNYTNYIVRQAFTGKTENIPEYKDLITNEKFISEYSLTTRLAKIGQIDYRNLKAQCSQQVVNQVYTEWKSFFRAIKSYKKNKALFKGVPKLPNYKSKNGMNVLIYPNQSCSFDKQTRMLKLGKNVRIKSVILPENIDRFRQVRIVPKNGYFQIDVVYDKKDDDYVKEARKRNQRKFSVGLDIGVDNLAAITSDNQDAFPIIVNGRCIKSINQFYNKEMAKLQQTYSRQNIKSGRKLRTLSRKRMFKIEDYFHKMSRYVVNWCIYNHVGKVFIGHNSGWKQNANIGKVNNQTFVQIPFNRFIQMLQYKLDEVGISVEIVNEAYSSKCSAIDHEEICKHEEYAGKRIHRGLFKTKIGKLINADVNGSLNILQKGLRYNIDVGKKNLNPKRVNEVCNVSEKKPANRGLVFNPNIRNDIEANLFKDVNGF